jgi:hypothetical protein
MRGTSFERRARRRSIYYVVMFIAVTIVGTVLLVVLLAAGRQRVRTKLYTDPQRTLLHVVAETETRWRIDPRHKSYATLEILVKEGAISDEFLDGLVEGYRYRILSASANAFAATADPEGPAPSPEPGARPRPAPLRRHYYVDETHTIRAEVSKPAGPESPIIWSPRDATH